MILEGLNICVLWVSDQAIGIPWLYSMKIKNWAVHVNNLVGWFSCPLLAHVKSLCCLPRSELRIMGQISVKCFSSLNMLSSCRGESRVSHGFLIQRCY